MSTNRGGGGLKPSSNDIAVMRELSQTMLGYARRCDGRLGLDLALWSARISRRAADLAAAAPQDHQSAQDAPGPH